MHASGPSPAHPGVTVQNRSIQVNPFHCQKSLSNLTPASIELEPLEPSPPRKKRGEPLALAMVMPERGVGPGIVVLTTSAAVHCEPFHVQLSPRSWTPAFPPPAIPPKSVKVMGGNVTTKRAK